MSLIYSFTSAFFEFQVDPGMETFTKANGQLEDTVIRRENNDVACRVQDRRTNLAVLQVLLHSIPSLLGRVPSRYSEI